MDSNLTAGYSRPPFTVAQRVNRSLTANAERRILEWMAARVPDWVTSDRLTAAGLGAQVAAGILYAVSRHHRPALLLVNVCIALNWVGDSMDGTVARVRHQQRPRYGFYVDHMVDILGATALMAGLGYSGLAHWKTAASMLVAFLLLSAESYLASYSLASFELSQGFFGPTEIRLLLMLGNLAALRRPYGTILGRRVLLFDVGGAVATTGMVAILLAVAARHTVQLYRQEPLPGARG